MAGWNFFVNHSKGTQFTIWPTWQRRLNQLSERTPSWERPRHKQIKTIKMSDEWDLKILCMGAGYVGGPTMAVIAKMCPKVRMRFWNKQYHSWQNLLHWGLCRIGITILKIEEKMHCCCYFFSFKQWQRSSNLDWIPFTFVTAIVECSMLSFVWTIH